MIDRPPHDLSDIWEDGPTAPPPRLSEPPPRQSAKPQPRQKRRPARSRWLSIFGYGGLALACLAVGAVAFLLVAAPVDLVRDRVIEQVKARTGRDLVVAGATTLSLFPRPAVSLSDVSLSAPEGVETPPTLVVPTVDAELRLWALVTGGPAIERITLHRPTIELSVDATGRRSWEVAGGRSRSRPGASPGDGSDQRQPSSEPSTISEREPPKALAKLGAATIRIVGGTARYSDHRSATHTELESLNLTLAADDPSGPLKVNGTLSVRGAPVTVAATVSPMQSVLSRQPAQLALTVSGSPFEGTYQGTISLDAGIALDGTLKLQAASARALADWLGRPLPAHDDSDAAALSAGLKMSQGQVMISNLQANVGAATMAGSLTLDTQQQRRRLSGNLQLSELDFGRLLVSPGRDRSAAPPGAAAPPAAAPPPTSAPPPRQGKDRGWRDDTINLSILRLLDANLTVSARRLIHREIKTGPAQFTVGLEGGVARLSLEDVELYGGRARGFLTLDGSGDVLVAGSNLILNRVALRPFLADALQFPWLEGSGNIYLELAGQGLTERQIVEGLNGKVEITSVDGAIVGLDISKIVRSLQQARLPSFSPSPDEKTPYSELAATFNVTNGVAKNHDLKLTGANLHLSGEGTLDLGPRQIDYTVRTKVGGGAPEPDATIKVGTLEVPVSIVGPWDKPTFGIKGQEQLTGALKQIRKNLKSQDVRDAIKGLLQGDGEKRVKPRDLIEKLLKKD